MNDGIKSVATLFRRCGERQVVDMLGSPQNPGMRADEPELGGIGRSYVSCVWLRIDFDGWGFAAQG